jgi:signal transduction histidine kinase
VGTNGGLSRIRDGRVLTLTSKNGLPCDGVHWSIEDDEHFVWVYMPCGMVRIARSELDAWVNDPNRRLQATVFDASDGVRTLGAYGGYGPHVSKASDGKIWFVTYDGVSVIDPRYLPVNKLPPPVHIEEVTADRKTYDVESARIDEEPASEGGRYRKGSLRLPPLVRDLRIDYTALSLVVPEKVRFRYKLEGWDRDWQDAGNRRQAFYTNLSPRKYRFRVSACNNSGVWNEAGTFLDFSVAPAYYQTIWFRSLCVVAFLALLWGLYQLRLRQVAQQFNMRLEERVSERTRIARDLHDTLLQSFHGLLLRFQAATNLLPDSPEEAKRSFESAIEQAAQAITEGRDAVQGLRSSTVVTNDLALAIGALSEELGCGETNPNCAEFDVEVEGTPRDLHPILRDEVYRIAGEAVRNAFKHAQAQRVEVEIRYDERELRLRVRDDGKGIDAKLLNNDERPGHYGLRGMRERAKLLGGHLAVWSELDSGTEVELSIPASRAYTMATARLRSWLAGRFSQKNKEIES